MNTKMVYWLQKEKKYGNTSDFNDYRKHIDSNACGIWLDHISNVFYKKRNE